MAFDALSTYVSRILLGLLAALICLGVHELGHLAAGLAVGFRFYLFALGPLMIERDRGRLRLGWQRDPALFGGVAATVPVRLEGLRPRFAAAVAAGPVASLLLALGAAAALPLVAPSGGVLAVELKWIRLLSAGVFLFNALPMANGPFATDGRRLARVLGRGPAGERESAVLALSALEAGGVRPREWDAGLISAGLAVRDGSMVECQFHIWSYLRELDSGRPAGAGAALDRAVALAPRAPLLLRTECLLESAFFEASYRGRLEVARSALASVPRRGVGISESCRLRAEAAVAVAEGRPREAVESIARALEHGHPGIAGREWLEDLRRRALSRAD